MAIDPRGLSPKNARAAVRELTFPNQQTEQAAVQEIDGAANAVVARHNGLLKVEAHERMEAGREKLAGADDILDILTTELRHPLGHGAEVTSAMSARYVSLEADALKAIDQLERAAAGAENLARRMDDPAEDFERIWARFPALRRPLV